MEHQHGMTEILQDLADAPLKGKSHTTHSDRMAAVLRHFSGIDKTLRYCCREDVLNREWCTLTKYCRIHGIKFSDYTPNYMKEKKNEARTEEKAAN